MAYPGAGRWLAAFVIAFAALAAQAMEVIAVEQVEKSFFVRSEPTLTLLRESPKAAAVLVVMPGGEGRLNLRANAPPDDSTLRSSFSLLLKALADPAQTSGTTHVVLVDSPYSLSSGPSISARATKDHLVRIESVVRWYRERYHLPVWIMGHSNGGFSVAEFLKYLQDKQQENLLSGMIFSAGRVMSTFGPQAKLPALFMSAERDGCASTNPAGNQRLYEKFKAGNQAETRFASIKGGEPQGDPCFSGIHMYHTAHEEVAKVIDDFLVAHRDAAPDGAAR